MIKFKLGWLGIVGRKKAKTHSSLFSGQWVVDERKEGKKKNGILASCLEKERRPEGKNAGHVEEKKKSFFNSELSQKTVQKSGKALVREGKKEKSNMWKANGDGEVIGQCVGDWRKQHKHGRDTQRADDQCGIFSSHLLSTESVAVSGGSRMKRTHTHSSPSLHLTKHPLKSSAVQMRIASLISSVQIQQEKKEPWNMARNF